MSVGAFQAAWSNCSSRMVKSMPVIKTRLPGELQPGNFIQQTDSFVASVPFHVTEGLRKEAEKTDV